MIFTTQLLESNLIPDIHAYLNRICSFFAPLLRQINLQQENQVNIVYDLATLEALLEQPCVSITASGPSQMSRKT